MARVIEDFVTSDLGPCIQVDFSESLKYGSQYSLEKYHPKACLGKFEAITFLDAGKKIRMFVTDWNGSIAGKISKLKFTLVNDTLEAVPYPPNDFEFNGWRLIKWTIDKKKVVNCEGKLPSQIMSMVDTLYWERIDSENVSKLRLKNKELKLLLKNDNNNLNSLLDNQEFRDTLDTIINISEKLYLPPIQTTWTWIHKS